MNCPSESESDLQSWSQVLGQFTADDSQPAFLKTNTAQARLPPPPINVAENLAKKKKTFTTALE